MTNAFILCNLLWKVQKNLAVNREGSFKYWETASWPTDIAVTDIPYLHPIIAISIDKLHVDTGLYPADLQPLAFLQLWHFYHCLRPEITIISSTHEQLSEILTILLRQLPNRFCIVEQNKNIEQWVWEHNGIRTMGMGTQWN